jgi:uncharacterized membrane-anchored protein YhcB (DUF1043 family)
VHETGTLILATAAALLLGALLGVLISRQLSPDNRKQRELERNLDRLMQQQKEYQHDVTEHFTDTAKLLNNLAESYRDVHNHLAAGAVALCDDPNQTILPRIAAGSADSTLDAPEVTSVQQPLDYAPKTSPHQTGMLNEEFGLEKKPANEEPENIEPVAEPERA